MLLQFATSVMVCGGYEDDADNGDELTYTGMSIPSEIKHSGYRVMTTCLLELHTAPETLLHSLSVGMLCWPTRTS